MLWMADEQYKRRCEAFAGPEFTRRTIWLVCLRGCFNHYVTLEITTAQHWFGTS